ncbi:hypothetical protein ACN28E_37860 [Archangium lansingense]|uniref:hypothetical protein n=1 Tax=Archangium lansingense TaxID=2995310 RepID=UPI003B79AEAC
MRHSLLEPFVLLASLLVTTVESVLGESRKDTRPRGAPVTIARKRLATGRA